MNKFELFRRSEFQNYFFYPKIIPRKKLVSNQYELNAENTRILSFWKKFPYDIQTDFYMWNISNPDDILNGDKPQLQQIGPFPYALSVERRNIEFGDGNISYTNYQEYTKLPSTDYSTNITTINGPFMFIQQIQHQLPKWLQILIGVFLKENDYGPFITKPVNEIIWGYDDPFLSFLNKHIPGLLKISKFGYYINQNETNSKIYTADSGKVKVSKNLRNFKFRKKKFKIY